MFPSISHPFVVSSTSWVRTPSAHPTAATCVGWFDCT